MKYDYLVDHARRNVWCTPAQDSQVRLQLARLTPFGGAWNTCNVLWRRLALPEQGPHFHVFQIGQIHPNLLALFNAPFDTWESLADCAVRQKLISDVYNGAGVEMPRHAVWYCMTRDRDLILAVKQQRSIPIDFNNEPLFLRLYANAYFQSTEVQAGDGIDVQGMTLGTSDDIMAMQTAYFAAVSKPGATYGFVNGLRVKQLSFATMAVGDVVEFVYDSSVYQTAEFTLGDLPTFVSTLDAKHKYLVHTPGIGERGIDYQDDVDVFLFAQTGKGDWEGVFYHRNQQDAMRMVTHKDYALCVPYVSGMASQRSNWSDVPQLHVVIHVRKSGYNRPLVFEANRISELYKMSDADVVNAMVGIEASVPVWAAASLEASAYCNLMRAKLPELDRNMVEQGYGYNAISKLLADTPRYATILDSNPVVQVPYGLQFKSTAYEYDANGKLKGWFYHPVGTLYTASAGTALVEMVAGRVDTLLDETYGNDPVALDAKTDYRFYRCGIDPNTHLPNNKFQDVTGSGVYAVVDGVATWLHDTNLFYGMVRGNSKTLGYTVNLPAQSGNLRFSLTSNQLRGGTVGNTVMQVPMGELDLWLNGNALIENLDYFVRFPEIVIVNKSFLVNPQSELQTVMVRFSGFCASDFSREVPDEIGFIKYGLMSHNSRFDIRDDKVLRIVVGGALKTRADLKFSETDAGITVPDATNGTPYQVRDIVVPLRGATNNDTYALRALAKATDKQISDYLTLKLPEPTFSTVTAIAGRYPVFSPFCCAIISDLLSGVLAPAQMAGFMSDQDVFNACKPYEFWLNYDPTQDPRVPDQEFVVIHPHNLTTVVTLDAAQYRFVSRVVSLYLHNLVSLSGAIQLS